MPGASVRNPARDKVMRKEADIRKVCSDFRGQGPGARGQGPGAGGQFLGPASQTSLSAWFLGTLAPPVSFSLFLLLSLSFSLLFTLTSG